MGCDIHAMIERRSTRPGWERSWVNAGDPEIERVYSTFAALAGVRNQWNLRPIAAPRGLPGHTYDTGRDLSSWGPDAPCYEFQAYYERWRDDAHSASWVTLDEVRAYSEFEELGVPSSDWIDLVLVMDAVREQHVELDGEGVRLVFFFDN